MAHRRRTVVALAAMAATSHAFLQPASFTAVGSAALAQQSSHALAQQRHQPTHYQAHCWRPPSRGGSRRGRLAMTAADGNNAQRRQQAEGLGGASPQPVADDEPVRLPEIRAPTLTMTEDERVALWDQICVMEPRLQAAIEDQDFATAEQLRDSVQGLKAQDPYFALREAVDAALARDDYYSAAKFKLQLDKLGPPLRMLESVNNGSRRVDMSPSVNQAITAAQASAAAAAAEEAAVTRRSGASAPAPASAGDGSTSVYSTRSEAITNGVRIEVRSQYYPEQSNPGKDQYVFVYRVRISNGSGAAVQLVSRKWQIRTANAQTGRTAVQEVKGPGVVGQQPVIEPGQVFEYSSACPIFQGPREGALGRVLGRMEGSYLMVTGAIGEQGFEAKIAPFHLILPTKL